MELSSKRHLLYLCPHRQPSLEALLQAKHLGLTWVDSTHLDAAVAQTQQLIQALLAIFIFLATRVIFWTSKFWVSED